MNFDATAIALATKGTLIGDAPAGPIATDTRSLPAGAWFLALVGPRFDGHDHVEAALAAGAVGAIVSRGQSSGGCVQVEDTTRALQDLGRYARGRFPGPVVGLTGSSGKTTTRALTALALAPLGPIHQTVGNLNNHLGVPMTLCAVPPEARAMVVEMGTSGPGEIRFLAEMATPDIRLIVNIGPAHLLELGGLDGVEKEKGSIFDTAPPGDTVVVNLWDARVARVPVPPGVRRVTVGPGGDLDLIGFEAQAATLSSKVRFATPEGEVEVVLPAFGRHFAEDAALALGVAWAAGVKLADAAAALAGYAPVGMRMRLETLGNGVRVFNDAYNANPSSMKASLDALAALPGRRIAVLGDMLELGTAEAELHEEVVAHADAAGLDRLVLLGPRMGKAAGAASKTPVFAAATASAAGESLRSWLQAGDSVLVKGSRGARTEEVVPFLETP